MLPHTRPSLDTIDPAAIERAIAERRSPLLLGPGRWLFLHHDPEQRLEHVLLRHSVAGFRHPPSFERARPDIWALDFAAPGVSRVEYELELVPSGDDHHRHLTLDPLNELTTRGPLSTRSVALGLGYAEPIVAGPPPRRARGTLSRHAAPLYVDADGETASGELWIWRPPGCRPTQTLPLAIFLDGPEYVEFAAARRILENTVASGALARCRAVFLPPVDRNRQYAADPPMSAFLTRRLPETLAGLIPIPAEPHLRIGVGASLGGLAMLHAHVSHPGFFGGLVLQSGSFFRPATDPTERGFEHFDRISRFVGAVLRARRAVEPVRIAMTCGAGGENLGNNRVMLVALRRAGCEVSFDIVGDAHTWTAWRDTLAPALASLLPGPNFDARDPRLGAALTSDGSAP